MGGRNKPNRGRAAFGAGLVSLGPAAAWAEMRVNLPEGVTSISHEVYDLHMLILAICAAIGVLLFAVMFYSIYAHRRSKGAVAVQFHENALVEILWTVLPFVILVAMAVPATKSMIALHDTGDADVTVKVTGYQWKWQYEYLEDGIKFVSNLKTPSEQIYDGAAKGENYLLEVDNPLVLPVNKKVRFLITAADVLHAWWVPEFGWKQDATPGFVNEGWARIETPGTYRGQCAELCGRGHGFMPIVVEARSEAKYAEWVEERKEERAAAEAASAETFTREQLIEEGAKVYNASCAACHQAKGEGVPGAFPPLAGSAIAKGPVGAHIDIVLNGKPNTAMLPFGGQLDDLHIAAVVTYERNAFGNAVGDRVQPADVKAAAGQERLASQKAEEEKVQAERNRLERENLARQKPNMPEFPWPPPRASATAVISCERFQSKTGVTRFGDVDTRLTEALEENGYSERSYYAVPDGFAVVTRIEQINDDGTPRGEPQRWRLDVPRLDKFSLSSYLSAVFLAPPGYYRVIVLFVTPRPIVPSESPVTTEEMKALSGGGASQLSPSTATQDASPKGYPCAITIFVYEFKRRTESDQPAVLTPGQISGHMHLVGAGLWTALTR